MATTLCKILMVFQVSFLIFFPDIQFVVKNEKEPAILCWTITSFCQFLLYVFSEYFPFSQAELYLFVMAVFSLCLLWLQIQHFHLFLVYNFYIYFTYLPSTQRCHSNSILRCPFKVFLKIFPVSITASVRCLAK